jgi:ribonuclease HI
MELMAAIVGLKALKEKCKVTLYSDSAYLVKAIAEGWAKRWRKNNWRRNKKERALNPDLWEELLQLSDTHQVEFKWVKGHARSAENNRCDELALEAAQQPSLPVDQEYDGRE